MRRIAAVLGILLAAGSASAAGQSPDVRAWLQAADAVRNAFDEAIISARATQLVNGAPEASVEFDIYTKGRDRALLVFRDAKNRGRKILTSGDRMWILIPGARNPVPITPNQRLVGGASVGDLARLRFADDFTAALRPDSETVGGRTCRVLDLTAKSPGAPYPKVTLSVDEKQRTPCKALFALPSGKPAKEVLFTRFAEAAGRKIVSEMEIRDLLSPDTRRATRLEYVQYRPAKIDDKIFTTEGARAL